MEKNTRRIRVPACTNPTVDLFFENYQESGESFLYILQQNMAIQNSTANNKELELYLDSTKRLGIQTYINFVVLHRI